jgi:hypothetical protein
LACYSVFKDRTPTDPVPWVASTAAVSRGHPVRQRRRPFTSRPETRQELSSFRSSSLSSGTPGLNHPPGSLRIPPCHFFVNPGSAEKFLSSSRAGAGFLAPSPPPVNSCSDPIPTRSEPHERGAFYPPGVGPVKRCPAFWFRDVGLLRPS